MSLSPCIQDHTFCWDEVTGEPQGWTPFFWLSSVELTAAMGSPCSFWDIFPLEVSFHQHKQQNRSRNLHLGGRVGAFASALPTSPMLAVLPALGGKCGP